VDDSITPIRLHLVRRAIIEIICADFMSYTNLVQVSNNIELGDRSMFGINLLIKSDTIVQPKC
jgi:hypothetical protein